MQRLILSALFCLFLPTFALAQLDLPKGSGSNQDKPVEEKPAPLGTMPHLECTTCNTPNYVTTIDPSADEGKQKAWCMKCQNVRLFRRVDPASVRQGNGLDLPAPTPAGPAPQATPAGQAPQAAPAPVVMQSMTDATLQAAQSILADVRRLRHPDPVVLNAAADSLVALGDAGLLRARISLSSQDASELLVASRALLLGGVAEDAERVAQRMLQALPPKASMNLVKQVIELNPVVASPRWLASMLEHPQNPARLTAYRALRDLAEDPKVVTQAWPEFLEPLLQSTNAEARYRALDLLSLVQGADILDAVFSALSDPRAKVARRAVDILTNSDDPRVEPELMVRCFGSRFILRENAYALLVVIEREDKYLRPLLHKGHVETLLRAMDMNEEMVSNTAALALAGIGFRMEESSESPWLDMAVMDHLVGVVAAIQFFDDRSSLVEPCLRRLQMLSGRNYGENGPRWAEWWLSQRHSFRASRAAMSYGPEDHLSLSLTYRNHPEGVAFVLLGPDRLFRPDEGLDGARYFVTSEQSDALVRLLEEQGALGAAQPPGPRGDRALQGQELLIRLGSGAKTFALGPQVREPWFERLAQFLQALRAECDWQDYFAANEHVDKQAWVAYVWQNGGVPTAEPAHSDWLREVYLHWCEAQPLGKRQAGLEALAKLQQEGHGPGPMEFDRMLELLGAERTYGRDAQTLYALCLHATGLRDQVAPSPEAALLGERLLGSLMENFGDAGVDPMGPVLHMLGSERIRLASKDPSPLLRAAAGLQLLAEPTEGDWPVLEGLMNDSSSMVATRVLGAAGKAGRQEALPIALTQSTSTDPTIRSNALRTLGRLGGDQAREALMMTLTEPSGDFRLVAAEGLADLRDPKAAPLLVALLRNGREQGIQGALRRGLLDLGPDAQEYLIGALNSPQPTARREAALILGEEDAHQAAPALLRLLSEDPTDSEVVDALVGLTCVDLSRAEDRAYAWWSWWDTVRKDDAFSWFLAACATRGLPSPQPVADHFFRPLRPDAQGTLQGSMLSNDGAAFLLEVMRTDDDWLARRAWREWQRRSSVQLDEMPRNPEARHLWVNQWAESLAASR